jgi:hypothetical protein
MWSTSSTFGSQSQSQQSQAASTATRPGLQHSSTSFNVAAMLGASTSTPTNQLPPSWSSTLGGTSMLGANTSGPSVGGASSDPFASSLSSQRPTYLPGYLMSSMQGMVGISTPHVVLEIVGNPLLTLNHPSLFLKVTKGLKTHLCCKQKTR